MNKPIAFALLALAPAAVFAASFEGKVNFKMTTGRSESQEVRYNIKGDKIRVEMPGQKAMGGMIIDTRNRETTILMDEQKMYMTMAMPEGAAAQASNADDTKLEKTGETEKILGYTATKYVATSQGTKTDMWLAEGLGTFMGFSNPNPMGGGRRSANNSQASQAWERLLAGKDLFPLRVVGHEKNGKESFRMEATSIDKQSLPDSLFSPPAGYQKFDMGAMMKGMIPGMKR